MGRQETRDGKYLRKNKICLRACEGWAGSSWLGRKIGGKVGFSGWGPSGPRNTHWSFRKIDM